MKNCNRRAIGLAAGLSGLASLCLMLAACGPSQPTTAVIAQQTPAGSPVRCGLEVRKADNRVLHIVCEATSPFTLTDVVLNAGLCATPFDEDVSLTDVDDDPRFENSLALKRAYSTREKFALVLPRDCELTEYLVASERGEWTFKR